ILTKMDLRWGYNNVRIKEEDAWKAAVIHEKCFMYGHGIPRHIVPRRKCEELIFLIAFPSCRG
ncbi:hypothetical protein SERLADRAFT_347386, partial [Serpula lacrymans var. lacrymans S7.9]